MQTFISELFRMQLCRNDDHNLAQSTLLKNLENDIKMFHSQGATPKK